MSVNSAKQLLSRLPKKPVQSLRYHPQRWVLSMYREHHLIRRTCKSFGVLLSKIQHEAIYDKDHKKNIDEYAYDLSNFLKFSQKYRVHFHHYKEENILFQTIQDFQVKIWKAFIHKVIEEHEAIALKSAKAYYLPERLLDCQQINKSDINKLAELHKENNESLKEHIKFEDDFMFPFIQHSLTDEVNEIISQRSDLWDIQNNNTITTMTKLAEGLIAKYPVSDESDIAIDSPIIKAPINGLSKKMPINGVNGSLKISLE